MKKLEEQNNLLICKNKDGNIVVDVIYKNETLWLTKMIIFLLQICLSQKMNSFLYLIGLEIVFKNLGGTLLF